MIQRIQSIYISLAAIFTGLLFFIPIANILLEDNVYAIMVSGVNSFPFSGQAGFAEKLFPAIKILTIIAVLALLIDIFLFKNRKNQIKVARYIILMITLFTSGMIFFTSSINQAYSAGLKFNIGIIFPFIAIMLIFLAIRCIKKDEELVRSIDRIR
ncbi:MAG: DUF4293 domain-containing protein [Bacteroidota bacterium]